METIRTARRPRRSARAPTTRATRRSRRRCPAATLRTASRGVSASSARWRRARAAGSTGTCCWTRAAGLFWVLAHFARWVRPGAVRVGATAKALPAGVEAVAFAKAGEHVVQLVNSGGDDEKVAVCDGAGHVATLTLPALSITTAVY